MRVVLLPVESVDIVVHNMVTHRFEVSQTIAVATLVRRAKISRKETQNICECHFVLDNLIHSLLVRQC